MNAGYRGLLGRSDTTRFKAYLLAVALQMMIVPFLAWIGLIHITIPAFYPIGVILGGFLFGLAMNWGGGCAAGLWYKLGAGNIGAFVGILSMTLGYVAAETGVFQSIRMLIQSIGGGNQTVASVFNISALWISIPAGIILLFVLLKDGRNETWQKTGFLVGIIAIFAWIASSFSARPFGMAVMPGNKNAFDLLTSGRYFSWDLFFVLGIPIGSFVSTFRNQEFKWTNISGSAIWRIAGGGLLLGIGASLAGGCTVGHGLTGVPLLSLASIFFTLFAILGAWSGLTLGKKIIL